MKTQSRFIPTNFSGATTLSPSTSLPQLLEAPSVSTTRTPSRTSTLTPCEKNCRVIAAHPPNGNVQVPIHSPAYGMKSFGSLLGGMASAGSKKEEHIPQQRTIEPVLACKGNNARQQTRGEVTQQLHFMGRNHHGIKRLSPFVQFFRHFYL
eukprot:TRINITY_DN35109_c0_g1_i1.p2 TRINITY_DN35109_c0_g1~~TRINITY_DN35109_c0_g1_i1.p2  ORF type:complete len:151 (+),score=8.37 TRINITY_DN35109_c0_g1_i1:276-728(+)